MGKGKKTSLTWGEDENKERGNWTGKADFLLSTIGYAVGLGNIWRFPYKAYAGGGASFLIPYIIALLLCGIPMFFLELSFGQFASLGPITVWNALPLFKGVGWGMVMISFLVCIYYNMIIAYTLYYLFASFTSKLPWQDCKEEWNHLNISGRLYTCVDRYSNKTDTVDFCAAREAAGLTDDDDYMYTCLAKKQTPALLYWERTILDQSDGLGDGQYDVKWQLVLCLLLAWTIVFLCLIKGIKSSGKVVYFTALFPYVVLIILCIRNALLPGAIIGIEYYVKPDIEKLKDTGVWYSAAIQIFYSLGIAFGGVMTMSSYNRFRNNTYRDAILVACINCGTSIFAGFVIFSVIGYMSHVTGEDIATVVDSGPGLAFVAYPEGLATMPVAPLWSILFFLMLLTIGLDSQFGMMETVITALADEFELNKKHRHGKMILTLVLCIFMFLVGLPQCTRAGVFVMHLFDWYSASHSLIIVAFFEVIGLSWIYGFQRFKSDIHMMLGHGGWINASFYYYWLPCWIIVTPAMMVFILATMCMNFGPITYNEAYPDAYSGWADGVGFLMVGMALIFLPVIGVLELCKAHGCYTTWASVLTPNKAWGPALDKFRTGRYHASDTPEQNDIAELNSITDNVEFHGELKQRPPSYEGYGNPSYNTTSDRL